MSEAAFVVLNILTATLVGFFAGYITNDCALARMFKGFKGIRLPFMQKRLFFSPPAIVKSKDKLAESLGKVVRDRLIGDPDAKEPNRLFRKIQQDEFGYAIQSCVDELLSKRLPGYFEGFSISELEGYDETYKGIAQFINDFCKRYAGDIIQEALDNVCIDELFTENQLKTVAGRLLDMAADELRVNPPETGIFGNGVCLYDILGERETKELCFRLSKSLNIMDYAEKNSDKLERILYSMGLNKLVWTVLSNAANAPLSELLGNGSVEEFISRLQTLIKQMFESRPFRKILYEISDKICDSLNDLDVPLYNILPEGEWEKLISFLNSKFPDASKYLSKYLVEKRLEIDALIENEVDAVIREGTSNFFANTIRQLFRDVIIEYLRSIDIVGTLDKYIEKLSEADDVERALRSIVFELLKNNTVADVSQRFLSAETIYGILKNVQEMTVMGEHGELYRLAGHFRFADVVTEEAISNAADEIVKFAVPALVRCATGGESEGLDRLCAQLVYNKSNELMHTPIETLLKNLGIDEKWLYGKAGAAARRNGGRLVDSVVLLVKSRSVGISFGDLIKGKADCIGTSFGKWLSGVASRLGTLKPSVIFRKAASTSLAVSLKKLLHEKLIPSLMRKYFDVGSPVINKIQGMNTADVGDMMQRWFGKELRPLCWLGGGVGLIFGLALESTYTILGVQYDSLWPWLLRLVVFGLIGIVTNKIAIYGVFRPYKPNWTSRFGFSYIPRNISLVAEKSGDAIWFLLDGDKLSEKFAEKHDEWKRQLVEFVSKDDCAMLRELLKKNSVTLSDLAAEKLSGFIKQHSAEISEYLCEKLCETETGAVLTEDVCGNFVSALTRYLDRNHERAAEMLCVKLKDCGSSMREIGFAVKPDTEAAAKTIIGSFCEAFLDFDRLRKFAKAHETDYLKLTEKSIIELIPSADGLPNFAVSKLASKLTDMMLSGKTVDFICAKLEELLKKDMGPGQTISDIFGGRLCEIVDENLDRITAFFLNKIICMLEDSKDHIIEGLNRAARQKINVLIRAAIDLDDFTARTAERVIGHGLKPFFKNEAGNISARLHEFLDNEIYIIEVGRLQLDIRKLDVTPLIRHTVMDTRLRQRIQSAVLVLTRLSLRELVNQPTCRLMEALNIRSLANICDRLEPYIELRVFGKEILESLVLRDEVSDLISDMLESNIFSVSLGTLAGVYPIELLKNAADSMFVYFLKKESELGLVQEFIFQCRENHKDDCVGEYIDKTEFRRSVKVAIGDTNKDSWLGPIISRMCGSLMRNVNERRFGFISPDMREMLINAAVGATLETIKNHFMELLESIDVKNVVQQEINSMEGKEIEAMFNEFAQKQLNELVWMGKWGSLFFLPGLKVGAGYVMLSVIYMISGFKKQKGDDKPDVH